MILLTARNVGKTITATALFALLVGCGHTPIQPEQKVVTKTEYVVKVPPAEMLTIPAQVENVNVDDPYLKQGEVSKWLKNNEARTNKLENMLIEIGKFFKDEQAKLDEKAKTAK